MPRPPTDQMLKVMGAASVEAHRCDDQVESYCENAASVVDQLVKACRRESCTSSLVTCEMRQAASSTGES